MKEFLNKLMKIIFALYLLFFVIKILPLILPLLIKNPIVGFPILLVAIFSPLIAFVAYKKYRKRNFFSEQDTLKKIRNLSPPQFEEFICDMFSRLGYQAKVTGGPGDGGIEVVAEKDGIKHYIQCKKFISNQVSVGDVRNFYGAIMDKLSDAKSFFITTNVFTLDAEKFAEDKNIELIDGKKLMEYVHLSGVKEIINSQPTCVDPGNTCPRCGSELILRTAHKGANYGSKFYGCSSYPKCKFTKNI